MSENRYSHLPRWTRVKIRIHRVLRNVYERTFLVVSGVAGFFFLEPRFSSEIDVAYLFVLALPRSGSTLLAHVLATNPDVVGYGEHHCNYDTKRDLFDMASQNALRLRDFSSHPKYMMDKIVWPRLHIADSIKEAPSTRLILLARSPANTLSSMGKLHERWRDPATSLHDYLEGLDRLLSDAKGTGDPQRCFFIRFEDFIEDPDPYLRSLKKFLDVKQPFTREYNMQSTTGKLRYGDSSESIWSGKITPTKHVDRRNFPEPLLQEAETAYATFLKNMEGLALTVADFKDLSEQPEKSI